ncbi:MAG: porin [Gammaproteobacteria bacterium]|nr:porin [Gammaproteobacteria bacterium]
MRKTLLVTAATSALWASAAQATTLYNQDGTQLDIYGRIAMGIAGGGPAFDSAGNEIDNGAEFVDVYSRLGFRMSQAVTSELMTFGRLEWRFRGDERIASQAFSETRQSYIGLESKQYGTLQAGNFDSLYYQFVSAPFDVYLDRGLLFNSTGLQSRGDSIGYYTPDLHGFTSFIQIKHYSERGLTTGEQNGEGNEVAAQGGIRYQQGAFKVGLGVVDNAVRGGGNDEMLYGLIGAYGITDQFTVRLGAETQKNSEIYGGGFDTFGVGGTFTTGPWAFNADIYNVERDNQSGSNAWAAGAYYKVSTAFDVFVELTDGDAPTISRDMTLGDLTDDVYWLTGARYLF